MTAIALPASAAPTSSSELEGARRAFADGLALEAKEHWAEALERFERAAAVRASPQVTFHRGLCLEHTGRLVEALDAFLMASRDALSDANARRVVELAGRHATSLRKRLPVVILHAPRDASSLTVRMDGQLLATAVFELPLPIDPGDHRLLFEVPDHAPVEERISVREAEHVDVNVRVGAALAASTPPPDAPASVVAPASAPVVEARERRGDAGARRVAEPPRTWIVGPAIAAVAAVVSFSAAGVFYGLRGSAIDELRSGCNARDVCPEQLRAVGDRGRDYTVAGNIALGVGAAATLAAVGTWFYLRPSRRASIAVSATGSLLVVEGQL